MQPNRVLALPAAGVNPGVVTTSTADHLDKQHTQLTITTPSLHSEAGVFFGRPDAPAAEDDQVRPAASTPSH